MIRRLSAIFAYLEIDNEEWRVLVQCAAAAILLVLVLICGAIALGAAYRIFTCTGGLSC